MFLLTTSAGGAPLEPEVLHHFEQVVTVGEFECRYDGDFQVAKFSDGIAVFEGQAFKADMILPEQAGSLDELHNNLRAAVGHFTCIFLRADAVIVACSLYRSRSVYYARRGSAFVISDQFSIVASACERLSINRQYCKDFLNDDVVFGNDTFLAGVFQIPLGGAAEFCSGQAPREYSFNICAATETDVVAATAENIKRFGSDEWPVFVLLSGGLDSSMVLWAAKTVRQEVKAVHLVQPEDVNSSEEDIAREVAAEFGSQLVVINLSQTMSERRSSFKLEGPLNDIYGISPIALSKSSREAAISDQLEVLGETHGLFVGGHGGDHVFLQSPSSNVGFDAYKNAGILGFINEMKKLSRLKQIPFLPHLLQTCRPAGRHKRDQPTWVAAITPHARSKNVHHLLAELDPRSAKFGHVRAILLGLYQHETLNERGYRQVHPILMQNVIAHVVSRPVSQLYSDEYDRITLRREFYQHSSSPVAWRRSKRSSSGMIFNFMNNNADIIYDTLGNGVVSRCLGIDKAWLDSSIAHNANVGIDEQFAYLFNALHLEMVIKPWEDRLT